MRVFFLAGVLFFKKKGSAILSQPVVCGREKHSFWDPTGLFTVQFGGAQMAAGGGHRSIAHLSVHQSPWGTGK